MTQLYESAFPFGDPRPVRAVHKRRLRAAPSHPGDGDDGWSRCRALTQNGERCGIEATYGMFCHVHARRADSVTALRADALETLVARLSVEAQERVVETLEPAGHYVYVLLQGDQVLYVGMSSNVLARLGTHTNDRRFLGRLTRVRLIRCKSRAAAIRVEAQLIRALCPLHNIAQMPDTDHISRREALSNGRELARWTKRLELSNGHAPGEGAARP